MTGLDLDSSSGDIVGKGGENLTSHTTLIYVVSRLYCGHGNTSVSDLKHFFFFRSYVVSRKSNAAS